MSKWVRACMSRRLCAFVVLCTFASAAPAFAEPDHGDRRHSDDHRDGRDYRHFHHHWHRYDHVRPDWDYRRPDYGYGGGYYRAPPVVYNPGYYQPPPVVYGPRFGVNISIP